MEIKIEKRELRGNEIDLLVEEIRKFPNPLTGRKTWQGLKKVYIVSNDKDLIGVCGTVGLNNWVKLGPFVIFKKYHRQGFGRMIIEAIVKDYKKANLFIGSRNPAVAKIALGIGFHEDNNFWLLPNTIKLYLMSYIIRGLDIYLVKEFFRKKPIKEGPYRFFLKERRLQSAVPTK